MPKIKNKALGNILLDRNGFEVTISQVFHESESVDPSLI